MFWTLIDAAFAGLAGAGIGMLLRSLSRGRLPRGIMPVAAGLAMLATTISLEYTWYGQNLAELPSDTVVVSTREVQAVYKPWTYLRPQVRGFIAFAPSEAAETVPGTDVFVVQAHIRERWQPAIIRPVLIDCRAEERLEINGTTQFGSDGRPLEGRILATGDEDPFVSMVCTT